MPKEPSKFVTNEFIGEGIDRSRDSEYAGEGSHNKGGWFIVKKKNEILMARDTLIFLHQESRILDQCKKVPISPSSTVRVFGGNMSVQGHARTEPSVNS